MYSITYVFCKKMPIFAPIIHFYGMLTKTTAIVLHNIKYGDSKMIVDMFTRSHGRMSFVVTMPKSAKSKIRKQLFQPLSMLSIEYDYRPKVQLQKIREATILYPYSSLPFDMDKLTVGMFIAEFLYHSLYGEQANEPMFDYIYDSLQWFDGSPSPAANFHLVFMMRLSLFLGFYPNLDDYVSGCVFDLRNGSFSSMAPLHSDYLLPDEASQMSLMMRMNYPTMHLFKFTRAQRNRLLDVIVQYYRLHIPGFPDMKSLDVLRNIYD